MNNENREELEFRLASVLAEARVKRELAKRLDLEAELLIGESYKIVDKLRPLGGVTTIATNP
jgi:hypothetical protein